MTSYNPKLKTWLENKPNPEAGLNNIQIPGEVEHIVWQHRSHEPSEYELNLVDCLIKAFAGGAEEIEEVVSALNEQGMLLEGGEAFTVDNLSNELARLGY